MAYDQENIFAKIIRREAPAAIVFEDEFSMAFMDAMPQVEGHTLVIPKSPSENLFDIDAGALSQTIQTTQAVAGAVKRAFDVPGIMIGQLNGRAAGQTVFHLHFHILPRFDGLEFSMHSRDFMDMTVLEAQAKQIRSFL